MSWKVLYLFVFTIQYLSGQELEDYEIGAEYDFLPVYEEYVDFIMPIVMLPEEDFDMMASDELIVDDGDALEDDPDPDLVSFAGPVHAKGTVSVTANFGSSTLSTPFSSMGPWMPSPSYPPYFFPAPSSSMPMYSHLPLFYNMFLPGMDIAPFSKETFENLVKDAEVRFADEVYLDVTHLGLVKDMPTDHFHSFLDSPNSLTANTGALTDNCPDGEMADDGETSSGKVEFGGYLPASGTIRIAAHF